MKSVKTSFFFFYYSRVLNNYLNLAFLATHWQGETTSEWGETTTVEKRKREMLILIPRLVSYIIVTVPVIIAFITHHMDELNGVDNTILLYGTDISIYVTSPKTELWDKSERLINNLIHFSSVGHPRQYFCSFLFNFDIVFHYYFFLSIFDIIFLYIRSDGWISSDWSDYHWQSFFTCPLGVGNSFSTPPPRRD